MKTWIVANEFGREIDKCEGEQQATDTALALSNNDGGAVYHATTRQALAQRQAADRDNAVLVKRQPVGVNINGWDV